MSSVPAAKRIDYITSLCSRHQLDVAECDSVAEQGRQLLSKLEHNSATDVDIMEFESLLTATGVSLQFELHSFKVRNEFVESVGKLLVAVEECRRDARFGPATVFMMEDVARCYRRRAEDVNAVDWDLNDLQRDLQHVTDLLKWQAPLHQVFRGVSRASIRQASKKVLIAHTAAVIGELRRMKLGHISDRLFDALDHVDHEVFPTTAPSKRVPIEIHDDDDDATLDAKESAITGSVAGLHPDVCCPDTTALSAKQWTNADETLCMQLREIIEEARGYSDALEGEEGSSALETQLRRMVSSIAFTVETRPEVASRLGNDRCVELLLLAKEAGAWLAEADDICDESLRTVEAELSKCCKDAGLRTPFTIFDHPTLCTDHSSVLEVLLGELEALRYTTVEETTASKLQQRLHDFETMAEAAFRRRGSVEPRVFLEGLVSGYVQSLDALHRDGVMIPASAVAWVRNEDLEGTSLV